MRRFSLRVASIAFGLFTLTVWAEHGRDSIKKAVDAGGIQTKEDADETLFSAFSPRSRVDFIQRLMLLMHSVKLENGKKTVPVADLCKFWDEYEKEMGDQPDADWLVFKIEHGQLVNHLLKQKNPKEKNPACGKGLLRELRVTALPNGSRAIEFVMNSNLDFTNPGLDIHYKVKNPTKISCDPPPPGEKTCFGFRVVTDTDSKTAKKFIADFQASRDTTYLTNPLSNYKDFEKRKPEDEEKKDELNRNIEAAIMSFNASVKKYADLVAQKNDYAPEKFKSLLAQADHEFGVNWLTINRLCERRQNFSGRKALADLSNDKLNAMSVVNLRIEDKDPGLIITQMKVAVEYRDMTILSGSDTFLAVNRVHKSPFLIPDFDAFMGMGGSK